MKVEFMNGEPAVKPDMLNGRLWKFEADWIVKIGSNVIVVPKDFICDFASTPRIVWTFRPPATGKHRIAALVHDFLYASEYFDRNICDNIFYDIMRMHGVYWFPAKYMYLAVCAFGGAVWNSHDPVEVKKLREESEALTKKYLKKK